MKLQELHLADFRNYASVRYELHPKTSIFVGPNAIGKTNILEAVYLLATGESFRARKIEEMVRWDAEVGHVSGMVIDGEHGDLLRVSVNRGMVMGKRVQKRRYFVNDAPKRKADFVGRVMVILFRPEDLRLLSGSPAGRRALMDELLIQTSNEYRTSLFTYEKALRRRNRLLDQIRERAVPIRSLTFWNELLLTHGIRLAEMRRDAVLRLNTDVHLSGQLRLEYVVSALSRERLQAYQEREIASGHTLIGPHKDDMVFQDVSQKRVRDLGLYGSRGEQRMSILRFKLATLRFMQEARGVAPILMLDDVFSELDQEHEAMVLGLLGSQQSILTTTHADDRFARLGGCVYECK